ncbi:MAG TPA: hypothetical protein VF735_22215 [Pyrinomonadaceae bacterium]|jgi:hypothetical protein
MEYHQDKLTIKIMVSLAAAVAFLLIVPLTASAQGSTRPKSRAETEANKRAAAEQELLIRGAVRDKRYEEDARRKVIAQAGEDFMKIQELNDNILGMLKAKLAFNYKSIGEMTSEIKKRAKRFKETTDLPPPADGPVEERKFGEIGQAEMKMALTALNARINSFVDNPLFQSPQWTDVKLGARASRDLIMIIELSGQIKKSAEKLGKDSK